jgi:spore coat polysaccharide biosynthesis protein SpsF
VSAVAIVQARMSSSRLPGKVLLPLGGTVVLGCVIERLLRARRLDAIVIATSTDPSDMVIEEWARVLGVAACRGPLDDVLARYALAARQCGADTVVRITADCPLIDPQVVDAMLDEFTAATAAGTPCDYLSNSLQRTFPRGLDAEVMSREALLRAAAEATKPHEREHVTPYLYRDGGGFRLRHHRAARDRASHRWTLDTVEDYRFFVRLFELLGERWRQADHEEIAALLDRHPEVVAINRSVRQTQPGE